MSKSLKIAIIGLILMSIFIGIFESTRKKTVDWRETYSYRDKIPFGSYIFYKELKSIFPNVETFKINQSLYDFLETYLYDENSEGYYSDILCIGREFTFGKAIRNQFDRYVENGAVVFISAYTLDKEFLKSFEIETAYFSDSECNTKFEIPRFSVSINPKEVVYDKEESCYFFSKLPKNAEILGYFHRDHKKVPYFIRIPHKNGFYYLHLEPKIFTNYYLLKKDNFQVAYHSINYLNGTSIAWFDNTFDDVPYEQEDSMFRFLLKHKSLRFAFYILLFCLIIYLIFRSKREQRAIPIVEPEQNKSVEFAKTISSLYYERGNPENMVQKKIEYFLFSLRKTYLVDTSDILNSKFHSIISEKLGLSINEVSEFFKKIQLYQTSKNHTENDLIELNQLIEEFKK